MPASSALESLTSPFSRQERERLQLEKEREALRKEREALERERQAPPQSQSYVIGPLLAKPDLQASSGNSSSAQVAFARESAGLPWMKMWEWRLRCWHPACACESRVFVELRN